MHELVAWTIVAKTKIVAKVPADVKAPGGAKRRIVRQKLAILFFR